MPRPIKSEARYRETDAERCDKCAYAERADRVLMCKRFDRRAYAYEVCINFKKGEKQ